MTSTPDACKCWQLSDFVSLNRYYGWYVMGGNQICDAEAAFRREMDAWGAIRGDKPFIFTEYGADTYVSEHKLPSVMWSQEYQNEYLDMTHAVFDSYPWIQGELVWNFADFQTTEGIMRVNGNKKGIFTRQRQPKDAAFLFKARWEKLPEDYKGNR
jgi:beta-glucuronidase